MKYSYKARTKNGEFYSGVIESSSPEAIIEALQNRDLIVTEIKEIKNFFSSLKEMTIFPEKVGKKDLVFFFKQLSNLFSADVALVEALHAVEKQSTSKILSKKIAEIASDVNGGMPLSQAFNEHPNVFSIFLVNMVKTGEIAGNLDKVLNHLAEHLEREHRLISKVKGAMYYPAFVMAAAAVVVLLMVFFLLPEITKMFDGFEQELPLPTKILLELSNFFGSYGVIILLVVFTGGVFFFRFLRTPSGKIFKSKVEINTPAIGTLFQNIYLSQISENLGTLIKGGLPIVQSIEVTTSIIGNTLYKDVLNDAKEKVRKGETIFDAFSASSLIPPTFSQMVDSGEKSGKLEKVLLDLSVYYNTEVTNSLENMMSLLEPILIVTMGVAVAFIAVAIIMPIYDLSGSI